MRFHSQNLTDGRLRTIWHGRAWLGKDYESRQLNLEWSFGKFASSFALQLVFGTGDDDASLQFHACIPWLFSIFITLDGVYRCKECQMGIGIHDGSFWFHPLAWRMESATKEDPWYRHTYCCHFPWELNWWSTEILEHGPNSRELKVVWIETRENRQKWFDTWKEREAAAASVSRVYPYAYILKNRTVQERKATVFVERMTWRARLWPLIPRSKVSTSISITFDKEVGEGEGSWKGGCTGCSYELRWHETPERCLSRMEHEREFRR